MSACFFTTQVQDGVAVVAIRAGLFDELPELGGGPIRETEVREELLQADLTAVRGVVLDVRAAGEINHRTLALLVSLVRQLLSLAVRVVVCGTGTFLEIWQFCGLQAICAAHSDLGNAVADVQG